VSRELADASRGPADLVPRAFEAGGGSFASLLARVSGVGTGSILADVPGLRGHITEGTTVLAVVGRGGVVVAGDRRATAGNLIARSDMRKVFPADSHSAIAVSGAAGPAMELAKLFATELEHYEKVEGERLSLEGKSTKLAGLVLANLPMAMQGLVVVPLLAGYDPRTSEGRIFEYDPVGGRYVATFQAVVGSGSQAARGALKRLADPDASLEEAAATCVTALLDAAEEDSATGGPDPWRGIFPIVAVIVDAGYREMDTDEVAAIVERLVAERRR
jgi:proteasome beta subunit